MSAVIRQIVAGTWTEYIGLDPGWSAERTAAFFDREAERLAGQINVMAAEAAMTAVREWTESNGRDPDHLTHVALIEQAQEECQEIVLTRELYDLIPTVDEDELAAPGMTQEQYEESEAAAWEAARSDPDRWRGVYRSEPTEETEDTVTVFWPDRSILFGVVAALLWQARLEDGLPLPRYLTAQDAGVRERLDNQRLLDELTAMVEDDLQATNLPLS